MVRSRYLVGAAVLVTGLALGACDGATGPDAGPAPTSASPSATAPSGSASPSTSPTTEDPVTSANRRLSDSLGRLAGAVSVLEADNDLLVMTREVRGRVADGRRALAAVRKAAYPSSTRSCTAVASGVRAAETAATRSHTAARGETTLTQRLADERLAVRRARGAVARDLATLQDALDGRDPAGLDTVDVAEVQKALDASSTSVRTSATTSADLDTRIRSDLRDADGFAVKARAIAAKVC